MLFRLAVLALALAVPSAAQQFAPLTIRQMTRKAGLIFAGTVMRVERVPGDVPELRVTFRVGRAVRGTRTGDTVTVREWISPLDTPRYRPGERLFLFLYGPGPNRLTSPVGGAAGCFSIDAAWNVVVRPDQARLIPSPARALPSPAGTRNNSGQPARLPLRSFLRAMRAAEAR